MSKTHGDSKHGQFHRLYKIWADMKNRCFCQTNHAYKNYGEKGITVCEEWQDYINFKQWALENGYADNLTIDRIDVNKGYSPDNCRWSDYDEQNNNKTSNHFITHNGQTHSLSEWARLLGIPRTTLSNRLNTYHWPIEKALMI